MVLVFLSFCHNPKKIAKSKNQKIRNQKVHCMCEDVNT
jgi:hypothetical protein